MKENTAAGFIPSNQHLRLPWASRAVTAAANRMSDWVWERRLNLRTAGRVEVTRPDAERYEPVPYVMIERVFDRLRLGPGDVFVDLGSGMGRVVCAAARRPVRSVIGVEIEPSLHEVAVANVARLRGAQSPVRLVCGSAADFDFAGVTAAGLFNPFGGETMRAVLRALRRSLEQDARRVRLAYINATCAHWFAQEEWLTCVDAWEMAPWSRIKSPVYFFEAALR